MGEARHAPERERERVCVRERGTRLRNHGEEGGHGPEAPDANVRQREPHRFFCQRERESVCVCKRERERVCVRLRMRTYASESPIVPAPAIERERERECVCV